MLSTREIVGACAFLIVFYYCVKVIKWYRQIYAAGNQLKKLPGSEGHWLLGHITEYPGGTEAALAYILKRSTKCGNRIFKFWFGPFRPAVGLVHPETVKCILKTSEPKAMKDKGAYSLVVPWLGDGLLLSRGKKWHRNRHLLTPAFHFDVLKPYVQIYNESVEVLMDKWTKQLETAPKQSIEVFSPVSLCTLDIVLQCAFSYKSDVQRTGSRNEYITTVLSMSEMIMERAFHLLWYFNWIYNLTSHGADFAFKCQFVHQFAEDIIRQRRKSHFFKHGLKVLTKQKFDFLDILLSAIDEDEKGLSDTEIRDEVDTFLFAGHDTTASAVSWCLYHLAKYPECQEKARFEVDQLLDGRETAVVTWDDLTELPYLTMCIRESMRCIPPVSCVSRDLTVPLEVDGVTLLPGTIVDVWIYAVHHNPTVWGDDHMEFKPERFDVENMKTMDPFSFIPFSAGPRNCIGQSFALNELKVVLARILHRFVLKIDRAHTPVMRPLMVTQAKDGIKLKLTARN